MTLLQQRDAARRQRRLELYAQVRSQLRGALADLAPGARVVLFGSITRPGKFNDASDIDLALAQSSGGLDPIRLADDLAERLQRPVDVVPLDRCRFRDKILREGESWTL